MKNKKSTSSSISISISNDDVDQLLQATQDELDLKLAVDSHMSRVAPDYLNPDLDRRFNALKSSITVPPQPKKPSSSSIKPNNNNNNNNNVVVVDDELKAALGDDDDDLSARFAALKASLPTSSSPAYVGPTLLASNNEEDEVNKVIQWAIDAARLDPSQDDDDEEEDEDCDSAADDDDDSDDSDSDDRRRKRNK